MILKDINFPVLSCLSDRNYISLKEISKNLNINTDNILKQIHELKKIGYIFSIDSKKNYRIHQRPDILLPQEIYPELDTSYIGRKIYYFDEVNSTNIVAREIASSRKIKAKEGTVIIADRQSTGKGRLGREWISPRGGLWFSILLFPTIDYPYLPLVTLMTAVAITRVIRNFYQINAKIKWPNDILIEGKKICGILTETSVFLDNMLWTIVGIGINVNNIINTDVKNLPEGILENSISLKEIAGKNISRKKLAGDIFNEFEKYYEFTKNNEFSLIIDEWKLHTHTIGNRISIDVGNRIITGKAIDISNKGALIIRKDNGLCEEIISGTIIK